jgi:hypothetical protein
MPSIVSSSTRLMGIIFFLMMSVWCANAGHHNTLPLFGGFEEYTMSYRTSFHPLPNHSLDNCFVYGGPTPPTAIQQPRVSLAIRQPRVSLAAAPVFRGFTSEYVSPFDCLPPHEGLSILQPTASNPTAYSFQSFSPHSSAASHMILAPPYGLSYPSSARTAVPLPI